MMPDTSDDVHPALDPVCHRSVPRRLAQLTAGADGADAAVGAEGVAGVAFAPFAHGFLDYLGECLGRAPF